MMNFWHGRLAAKDLKAAWQSAEAAQNKTKNGLEDVHWPCCVCKKELPPSHYGINPKTHGVNPKIDSRLSSDYWRRIMVPGEWRMCMNCKAELRGDMGGKYRENECRYSEHECRACHRVLPESDFNAERLAMWRGQKNYELIICLQCTPAFSTKWWEKLADKSQYTCSTCKKQLPRNAYSSQGFADLKAIVCMECSRAAIVRQKNLDKKIFDCRGPCQRSKLPETAFAAATLLKKDLKTWICSSCQ